MRREGTEIFHHSPLRENRGLLQFVETQKRSSQSPQELKFVCYISQEKNCSKYELMWFLVVFQHDFHSQCLPQVKEKLFLKNILRAKEEVICVCVHSQGIAPNKYYGAITKRMKFNCPPTETSESIKVIP